MDRSDLVRDLRNKALKDCHNPFRHDLHMKTENKLHQGDISRQIEKMGRKTDNMHHRLEATNKHRNRKWHLQSRPEGINDFY